MSRLVVLVVVAAAAVVLVDSKLLKLHFRLKEGRILLTVLSLKRCECKKFL
jgi:hypothetical protein